MSDLSNAQPIHQYEAFLNSLPPDWPQMNLAHIGAVVGGGTPSRDVPSFWHGSIPWVTPGEVSNEAVKRLNDTQEHISTSGLAGSGAKLLPANSLMITTRATLGARAINTAPMATNQGFKSIVFKDTEEVPYYFHLFEKIKPELVRRASGTTFLEISGAEFGQIVAPSPALPEKRLIAQVLDTLDTAIRETEAIIDKLKAVKKGLLHDLLTRGIDANGELRPLQAEAPHLHKASPLGWIPQGWSYTPTSERCSLITKGTTPASNRMWQGNEGVRFLRVDNLTFDGRLDFLPSNFRISPETHKGELARSRCLPGDVLTNIVGPPLGKLGLVTTETGEVNINQAISLFRPNSGLLSKFLMLWLGSSKGQTWLRTRAKQTSGQVNLTLALCQELPMPSIPLAEQTQIVSRIENAQGRIEGETFKLAKLYQLKSALMDDLLTGRVRVTPLLPAEAPAP